LLAPCVLAGTTANIRLQENVLDESNKLYRADGESVEYQPNTSYLACTCDLTSYSCDAHCCCDTDCAFNTKKKWADDGTCKNFAPIIPSAQPLSNCVARNDIEDYNRHKGISRYIDPFVQLFCVRFDRAPLINDYWTDDGQGLTAEKIEDLTSDPDVFKLSSTLFSLNDIILTDSKDRYDMGEQMR
jgi:hypothetical protein